MIRTTMTIAPGENGNNMLCTQRRVPPQMQIETDMRARQRAQLLPASCFLPSAPCVCVCVCMCMCMRVCACASERACVCVYVLARRSEHVCAHRVYARMCSRVGVRMRTHGYAGKLGPVSRPCFCIEAYACMHACTHPCVHAHWRARAFSFTRVLGSVRVCMRLHTCVYKRASTNVRLQTCVYTHAPAHDHMGAYGRVPTHATMPTQLHIRACERKRLHMQTTI
jgi:hypothetical protein